MIRALALPALSLAALALASCGHASGGDKSAPAPDRAPPYRVEVAASFDEPWAMAIEPGTGTMFVTEKAGTIRLRQPDGTLGTVTGVPPVAYGGQGGLSDIVFAPDPEHTTRDGGREVYLSWAEQGPGDTRGGALGRAFLVCRDEAHCALEGLKVIWRQVPKTTGSGQYALRIALSPDAKYLFVSSGERQKKTPAQDNTNNLGTIVRLLPDGSPAPGNPFAGKPPPTNEIWSYGHRNPLGLVFDGAGQLWDMEHGPRGGDELNRIEPGRNYGWPLVSDGDDYDGTPIPRNSTRPDLAQPAETWTPVIAPGDMIWYSGDRYPGWHGNFLVAGLASQALVRVAVTPDGKAHEVARYAFDNRLREIRQADDGTLWLLEDGPGGRLLHLVPTGAKG